MSGDVVSDFSITREGDDMVITARFAADRPPVTLRFNKSQTWAFEHPFRAVLLDMAIAEYGPGWLGEDETPDPHTWDPF